MIRNMRWDEKARRELDKLTESSEPPGVVYFDAKLETYAGLANDALLVLRDYRCGLPQNRLRRRLEGRRQTKSILEGPVRQVSSETFPSRR